MSADPVPHLRVIGCPDCERKDRMIAAMQVDLDNANVDLTVKRRKITRLENEAADKRRKHPLYGAAERIFDFWRSKCQPNARVFGPEREKAVLARLTDTMKDSDEPAYSPRYVCEAIVGAYVEPYVDQRGKRHNDLELICRTPSKLENFHERYERYVERRDA